MSKKEVQNLFDSMKAEHLVHVPLWNDIEKYTGIVVDSNLLHNNGKLVPNDYKDIYVDDPTSATSVDQAGDYLIGIMWGTGKKVVDIIPSRYVLNDANLKEVEKWYSYATEQLLYHMNHSDAGLQTSLRPYAYDQFAYGNSGIGVFKNNAFEKGIDDNALIFRSYGIDNTCIDEGKSGLVDYTGSSYYWTANRIVSEFAKVDGAVDDKKISKMPKVIREAYANKDTTQKFPIVNLVYPRSDFDPKFKGSRGTRFRGVWFLDSPKGGKFLHEESFAEKPIAFCRQIKVRNQVYGRGSGTMLLSTIKSVNFMISTAIEVVEKMSKPALGMYGNALFGDAVLDSSPDGLTIFNSTFASGNQNPLFPIHDVGDPSAIVQFLVPYLNEKVVTAFKIDSMLDFSSGKEMTATESMQRYTIRGKSLAGMLTQQKVECLEPYTKRSISLLDNLGELGINPEMNPERASDLINRGRGDRVIPQSVVDVMKSGRPWFELRFNNELEKLVNTEAVQNLLQVIQAIGAIASMYENIIEAVDWYKLLKDINDNLDANNQILISADDFKANLEKVAKQQQAMMMMQAGQMNASTEKDQATANKTNRESVNGK